MEISYQDINRKTIDRWVDDGWEWGKPISREVYAAAKNGQWDVKLTPVKFVPHDWFGDLKDRRVLGLAAGGGQQMPIFAALGAKCTVLDYSEKQLESERMVAQRESYDITIVCADMTKRLPFDDNSFDLIFHPVSNCYVYAVLPIWRECVRVLKPGGYLLRVVPMEKHLIELKAAVYDHPYENPPFEPAAEGFRLMQTQALRTTITLSSNEDVQALFLMTPYYYKTDAEDQKKLAAVQSLRVTTEFLLAVYQPA